jgi:hypothetical protein
MRTVVYVGLILIASAIDPNLGNSPDANVIKFLAILMVAAIIMDVCEFLKKLSRKN